MEGVEHGQPGGNMFMFIRYAWVALATAIGVLPVGAAPPVGSRIAYVRAGAIYVLTGTVERRLTHDSDDARPRWSPDGQRIAYVHAHGLWVINSDGTGGRVLANGPAGGPAWSPDGQHLAFAASCEGQSGVFQVATTGDPGAPRALFPADCRTPAVESTLDSRLRTDDAVAWSPDGTRIAFRGGECLGIYDDCLTVGDVATGREQVIAAYGGGGMEFSGFAVVPAWRPDGQRLSWTAAQLGDRPAHSQPVHVVEADPNGHGSRTVGMAQDREMVYDGVGRGVLTGQYRGASWVIAIDLASGARTPLKMGSQPSVATPR